MIGDNNTAGFNRNGLIIFDYVDANNFKYAGAMFGVNQWRIGHVTNGVWFADANFGQTLAAKVFYDVKVEMEGMTARLFANGALKTSFTFGDALNDGRVGLGTKGAVSLFDDFEVEQLV